MLGHEEVQVNQAWETSATPLFTAAHVGQIEVVEALLRREDIDVNKANRSGTTPLHIAQSESRRSQSQSHAKIEELLKEKVRKQLNENTTCIIYLDSRADVVLVPCGHQNLCAPCAYQWYEQ